MFHGDSHLISTKQIEVATFNTVAPTIHDHSPVNKSNQMQCPSRPCVLPPFFNQRPSTSRRCCKHCWQTIVLQTAEVGLDGRLLRGWCLAADDESIDPVLGHFRKTHSRLLDRCNVTSTEPSGIYSDSTEKGYGIRRVQTPLPCAMLLENESLTSWT